MSIINPATAQKNEAGGNGQYKSSVASPSERQLTLHDYLRVFYKGRYVILISFLIIVVSTIIYTFTTDPVYEASVKIMVEQQGGVSQSLFDFTTMMKKETMVNNQVEILKSRTLAENVIKELQASEDADKLQALGNSPEDEGRSNLMSIKTLLGNNGGHQTSSAEQRIDRLSEALRERISVTPIRNTDIIEIKVRAPSPYEAAYLANSVAKVYKNMNQAQSQAEVRQVKNFIEDQLSKMREELAKSEELLKSYKQKAKVVALDQETEELVRKVAEFETLYNEAHTELQANKHRLAYINQQLNERNMHFDVETIASQPYLAELKKQIAEKEAAMASYMASMIEIGALEHNKSEVHLRERQIEALKSKFKEEVTKVAAAEFVDPAQLAGSLFTSKIEVETEIQSLIPKVTALEKIVTQYNQELDMLPEKSLTLARLMRTAQVDEKIYIMLQEKYQESRITEVGQLGNVRIIDRAKEPKYPITPKKKLNIALSILVGLGLGVGIAFVMEYLDNTLCTMEDVERMGMPIMVTIPYIKPEQTNGVLTKLRLNGDPEARSINQRLVTHLKPKSPISEAYRTLRTNILFSNPDHPITVFLITSSGPKEGKSTTVSNLAITFAQMGNRTLLIDADLRRPIQNRLFGFEKDVGLTNVLVGRMTLKEATRVVDGLPNLHVLNCGVLPPNPAELLGSEAMRQLLQQARKEYNMILIDSPPTLAVTDASILSTIVDAVLLVIRSGGTEREAALRAHEQLKRVGAPVIGVVLNGIEAANVYGSYYYHYYYSDYYSADGKKSRVDSKMKKMGLKTRKKQIT
ncbi:polysaccharide biosynthesis tyrosine autokinase [candidate division KSB1 bacterium]|nr:polysaccharide biosynthesis tyrosine autokinase [candidate division KSB1 bacterium]